jgi:uncharacterized membrane protein YfcA
MEIAASLHMLPGIWREVHWRAIGILLLGYTLTVPLGVWFLASVPPAPMKIALGVCVLIAVMLLMRGIVLKQMPSTAATLATGGASGLLNGAFGTGGPPVILFSSASPAAANIGRASIVAYFLATDALGLIVMAYQGSSRGTVSCVSRSICRRWSWESGWARTVSSAPTKIPFAVGCCVVGAACAANARAGLAAVY